MKTVAYIRVSTGKQDLEAQKLAVMTYAQKEGFVIDEVREVVISSRKPDQRKTVDNLLDDLKAGDRLIVSELSRVGRSLGVIIQQINKLLAKRVDFIAVKEGLKLVDGKQDMQSKITVAMFGLFAEVERDLISERTKEGMTKAKQAGKRIGRPKGRRSASKLDGKEQEIALYLDKRIPVAGIARLMGCANGTLRHFIKSRGLEAGDLLKSTQ